MVALLPSELVMEERLHGLADQWLLRFDKEPPEWVDRLENLQDVDNSINDCQRRIENLRSLLEQELFLLEWLHTQSGQDREENETPPEEPPTDDSESTTSLRRRALEHVDIQDVHLAQRVKKKLGKSNKHFSIIGIDSDRENSLSPERVEHQILVRQRSMSESSVSRTPHEGNRRYENVSLELCPIPDTESPPSERQLAFHFQNVPSQVIYKHSTPSLESKVCNEIPRDDDKRLSNGDINGGESEDDDELMLSVKTVVASTENHTPEFLPVCGSLTSEEGTWMESSGTLKRGANLSYTEAILATGEKTPTGSLDASVSNIEQGITTAMVNEARSLSLDYGLDLRDAGLIFRTQDPDDRGKEEGYEDEGQNEDTGSINEFESSGYHTYSNLAESTLTYILRDTIFASRSNSVSSLMGEGRDDKTDRSSTSEVNLRPTSGRESEGKRKGRNRYAHFIRDFGSTDDITDEEHLQQMLAELQYSSPSPSSDLSNSGPSSPTHLIPYNTPINQCLSARSSRIYPMRQNTVVVHGEVMVIRKLVVAGIVTAEKAYLDCLNVAKEFYRKPLLALLTTTQPLILESEVNTIFYRVEDLHSLHSNLHEKLEILLHNWGAHSCIGDFFVELCKNLKLYKDYVEMYRRSLDCLEKCKQDPNFKKFLDDVRSTVSGQFKDVPNVNELLRKPIERLQSYSLVLNDLCQHTPEEHTDFSVLKQSLNVMSDFIASTHDPRAFQQLSGGFNRELVKQELVVELTEGSRKIRRLFLFHDVLISAKEKSTRHGNGIKLEPKWYLPLHDLKFHPPGLEALRPVPVTSDHELSVIKSRLAEIKAQLNRGAKEKERKGSTLDKDGSFKRNFKTQLLGGSREDKLRKKLQEQQVSYWVATPSLPLRLYGTNGKRFVFLLHNEDERESWITAMKKLQPKAFQSVSLSQLEIQDLLSRQKVHLTRDQDEVIEVQTDEDEYITGILRVRVTSATDLKAKQVGLHCALELDEYGRFDRKARTLPVNTDMTTLTTTWDQDFEVEIAGAHMMKVMVFSKYLLKEEVCASGKLKIPVKDLKSNKRCKVDIKLHPQGNVTLVLEYFTSLASIGKRPGMISSGVFGFPMDVVAKRERHDIPLIVQTCVDEVEKRGLTEVGIYRVAGVLRDVQELRVAFDTDYLQAQQLASETDIHAVAGLLKRYFRELPDPLFTDELYMSFVQALGLSDPEAREQSLVTLFHSLPLVNFKTAVYVFRHIRNIAAHAEFNKMTLNNLATVFGPNLFRPGASTAIAQNPMAAAFDVMSPVNILMFFLICPEEVYDELNPGSTPSSVSKSGSKKRSGFNFSEDDSTSVSSTHSAGFVTSIPSSVATTTVSSPLPLTPTSSSSALLSSTSINTTPSSGPLRFKQSVI